jgi:hypothetical protein
MGVACRTIYGGESRVENDYPRNYIVEARRRLVKSGPR